MARIVVLHSQVLEGLRKDEDDVLVQTEVVCRALSKLGYEPTPVAFKGDLGAMRDRLPVFDPALVFNLVETVDGTGRFIYLAPAVLDELKLRYTGASTEAVFLTSNKTAAKRFLNLAAIPTPPWQTTESLKGGSPIMAGTYIIKSVWEHASVGLDDDATVSVSNPADLCSELRKRKEKLGGECFGEVFIEGREFNLSLLEREGGPQVLPPAEILFPEFPSHKIKMVGYAAKWEPDSFEYNHTPRCFDFPDEDASLIESLKGLARQCWDLFALRGYARVDFRVDAAGRPWVLEVNTNPCLSPDAGFVAAAQRAGLDFEQVVEKIVAASWSSWDEHRSFEKHEDCKELFPGENRSGQSRRDLLPVFREEVKPQDCEHVRRIVSSSGFFSPEEILVAVELVQERLDKGFPSGYHFLFAETDGSPVGYTCFGPIACTKASYDLYWIAVANDFRSLGIGRELLLRSLRVMESLGGVRVYIETSSRVQYDPTRSFYRHFDFEEEAVLKDFYSLGDHKVIYVRAIK